MAQTDSKTKTIGNQTFRVRMLDPLVANDLFIDLLHVIAPGVAGGAAAIVGSDKDDLAKLVDGGNGNANPSIGAAIQQGFTGVIERLTKQQVRACIETLMPVTELQVGDRWPTLDSGLFAITFRGNLSLMYAWLRFALEVQFGDFIEAAKQGIAQGLGRLKSTQASSGSPTT